MTRDERAEEARQEAAYERRRTTYTYSCGGFASYHGPCGASDCGSCRNGAPPWEMEADEDEDDAEMTSAAAESYRLASRDISHDIRAGDLYRRLRWFSYNKGGPRTGYAVGHYLVARGPTREHHDPQAWARGMAQRERELRRRRGRK